MKITDIKPDLPVIITPFRDMMFDGDIKPFVTTSSSLPQIFPIVRLTKGGMVQIQVSPKLHISVPPSNVELWDVNNPINQITITENFIKLVKNIL